MCAGRSGYCTIIIKINQTQQKMDTDAQFLEYVVKALVDTPDAVKVDRKVDEMGVLMIVGLKNNARVNLKIEEPEGSTRPAPAAPSQNRSVDDVMADLKI
jgi:hypothetical protein